MFQNSFQQLRHDLVSSSYESLVQMAGQGGWRKAFLDEGQVPVRSMLDFSRQLLIGIAGFLRLFPAFGERFRRALVAQEILDRRGQSW